MNKLDQISSTLERHYILATDGSCSGNPGPGGWAYVKQLRHGFEVEQDRTSAGRDLDTTNNRMEMAAALMGLRSLQERHLPVIVVTDSEYLHLGMTERLAKWKQNGWRTADRKAVKNTDLWEALEETCCGLQVRWLWVRGHSGTPLNERADKAAHAALGDPALQPVSPVASRPSAAFLAHGFSPEH